ncbi:hypothetical protein BHE74_00053374 [Ensete ventricosum]|nr:hypothetical protein BHE74_00053374 [Ensete ventricosum]
MEVVPLSRGFGGWLEHLPEDTHRGYLVACVLATLGPHSSTKNVAGLYAMVEESASLVLLTCARLSASDWEDKGNSRERESLPSTIGYSWGILYMRTETINVDGALGQLRGTTPFRALSSSVVEVSVDRICAQQSGIVSARPTLPGRWHRDKRRRGLAISRCLGRST